MNKIQKLQHIRKKRAALNNRKKNRSIRRTRGTMLSTPEVTETRQVLRNNMIVDISRTFRPSYWKSLISQRTRKRQPNRFAFWGYIRNIPKRFNKYSAVWLFYLEFYA